jgi:hypothetical protein
MPVRISARSLGPLRTAATASVTTASASSGCRLTCSARHCHWQPELPSAAVPLEVLTENQAESVGNQRQAHAAHNGGHGGGARVRHASAGPQPPELRFAIGVCSGARTSVRVS